MKLPCPDPDLPAGLTQADIDAACGFPVRRCRTEEEAMERADYLRDRYKDDCADRGVRP